MPTERLGRDSEWVSAPRTTESRALPSPLRQITHERPRMQSVQTCSSFEQSRPAHFAVKPRVARTLRTARVTRVEMSAKLGEALPGPLHKSCVYMVRIFCFGRPCLSSSTPCAALSARACHQTTRLRPDPRRTTTQRRQYIPRWLLRWRRSSQSTLATPVPSTRLRGR